MRARVALATYARAPRLAPDDQLLPPALGVLGIDADAAVWSSTDVDWSAFGAVIIRSCWDYNLRFAEFLAWIERLESAGVELWNSPSIVRWNADKRYLLDLARRGIATVPTIVVPCGAGHEVESIVAAEGWTDFVLKPSVSLNGYETHAFHAPLDDSAHATIARVTTLGDALLQPFAAEVPRDGEYSFTFIDGELSHATLKRTKAGEFRVQTVYGGSVEPIDAPAVLSSQAAHALGVLPEMPLYARVDGIARGSAFLLMELELIEPNLFLATATGAADRFAAAIARRLETRERKSS